MRTAIHSIVALAASTIAMPEARRARASQIAYDPTQAPSYGWSTTPSPVSSSAPVAAASTSSSTPCETVNPVSASAYSASSSGYSNPASSSNPVGPASTSSSSAPPAPPYYSVPGNSTMWASTAAAIGTSSAAIASSYTPLKTVSPPPSPPPSASPVSPVATSSNLPVPPTGAGVVIGAKTGVLGAVFAGLVVFFA